MREDYNQAGIDALVNSGRPIPGQSLTNSPDQSYPWERPPEFTNFREALNFIAKELLVEDIYVPLIVGIGQGVPISDVALQILQRGFQEGKWNPDLLLLLLEPVMYLLMALCEKAGINDYRLTGDEEDDLEPEDENEIAEMRAKNLKKYAVSKANKDRKVPEGVLPKEIVEDIEELEIPEGLLSRPQQAQPSLLGQQE
tara:strand:- start:8376 stop:8969 length:594 start_codon:yes stop_codon:yes gene_type:complete